jgi:ParB family chromosome partitioning protein
MPIKKNAQLKIIPVEQLKRGEYQPRVYFDDVALKELASSIKSQGLIEPLVVRPDGASYEIIAGERRWRAAQLAELHDVPCLINEYTDEQVMAVTLIENIQREDLNPIEEAHGYQRLSKEFYFSHDDIAKMVGKSRTHITNTLRLLSLSDRIQEAIIEKTITMGHGKMLVGLTNEQQMSLLQKIIKNEWSARKVEQAVRQLKQAPLSMRKDRDVERLESLIAERCGAKAEIEQDGGAGGWLKIKFFDNDTLAGLLDKMGVKYD